MVTLFVKNTRQRMNALLLGMAAGVMITLSILDLILPNAKVHGAATGQYGLHVLQATSL